MELSRLYRDNGKENGYIHSLHAGRSNNSGAYALSELGRSRSRKTGGSSRNKSSLQSFLI